MNMIANKTSWSTAEIRGLIIEHGGSNAIWKLFYPGVALHPVIADLLERGVAKRKNDKDYEAQELEYFRKHKPAAYASRVATYREFDQINVTSQAKIMGDFMSKMQNIMDDYASSVLAKFTFNGKQLGLMNKRDLSIAIKARKMRSQTEVKQVAFLEDIRDRMRLGQVVKDALKPSEATAMWAEIEKKDVVLLDKSAA